MAADRYRDRQYPQDDDYGRGSRASSQQGETDPLAELARLIGQTDPFSNFGREQRASAPRAPQPRYEDERDVPSYEDEAPEPPAWVRHSQQAGLSQRQDYSSHYDETPSRDFAPQPPYAQQQAYGYDEPQQDIYSTPSHGYDHQPRFDVHQDADPSRYDDVLFGEQPDAQHDPRYDYDARYGDPSYPQDDEAYADEPRHKPRRGGMVTVLVVLALAILGTAGAYAFRTFMGSPRSGEPPIIKADAGPNKIVPAGAGDSKQIYDRVGDKTTERMVSREEQPVDVNAQAASPRVVFPPLSQNASPPSTSAVSPDSRPTGANIANGTLNGEEPRKIRTLAIHPDQPDFAVPGGPPPARVPASAQAPAAAASAARSQQAAPPARPAAAASAPVSLSPQSSAAPDARSRVASINPATSVPASGGSFVQVSSQKTEADALNSYKVLQSKYPGILGSRQAAVRRADLGDKGVYYRAMVGPFGTTDEATQFCLNLQSAGGKCIVQRN